MFSIKLYSTSSIVAVIQWLPATTLCYSAPQSCILKTMPTNTTQFSQLWLWRSWNALTLDGPAWHSGHLNVFNISPGIVSFRIQLSPPRLTAIQTFFLHSLQAIRSREKLPQKLQCLNWFNIIWFSFWTHWNGGNIQLQW